MPDVAVVMAQAGVTYRMLDHWVRQGFITCENPGPGTGHPRQFTEAQGRAAIVMATLVRAGFRPDRAAVITRLLPEGNSEIDLGYYGVQIHIQVRL